MRGIGKLVQLQRMSFIMSACLANRKILCLKYNNTSKIQILYKPSLLISGNINHACAFLSSKNTFHDCKLHHRLAKSSYTVTENIVLALHLPLSSITDCSVTV